MKVKTLAFGLIAAAVVLAGCSRQQDAGYTGNSGANSQRSSGGASGSGPARESGAGTTAPSGVASGQGAAPPASTAAGDEVTSEVRATNAPASHR